MKVSRASVRLHVDAERRELAAFLRGLTPSQWEIPSLCEGWRVRDVVAHLLYDGLSAQALLVEAAKAGFSPTRANERLVGRWGDEPASGLLAAFQLMDGGPLARWFPKLTLTDVVIHHQDVRRPLGAHRVIPHDRLLHVLTHPDPLTRPHRRTRGLRFEATDISWSRGTGPLVRGPGEAIVLTIAGRRAALDDLDGDGVPLLRDRMR